MLPSFANAHSHAFHRAVRGRTHQGLGSFWSWRERMYTVAERLTPDSYYQLARAVYAEMTLAGVTVVGEFIICTTTPPVGPMPTRTRWALLYGRPPPTRVCG